MGWGRRIFERFFEILTHPTINVESFCKKWSVGKEKLYDILNVLESIGFIRVIHYTKKRALSGGKGAKIFLADPGFYSIFHGSQGTLREGAVAACFQESGREILACKDETEGDFVFEGAKLEIGGKTKERKKSDWVIRDDVEFATGNCIPLWMLGCMW